MDLNRLVQLSLLGLVENPEQQLSNLLRSGQPIEVQTRHALADALDGRLKTATLKLNVSGEGKFLKGFQRKREHLRIGREVQLRPADQTFLGAVEKISDKHCKSTKTIESYHTLASRIDAWIKHCRDLGVEHSDIELKVAFIYCETKGITPDEAIKPSLDMLVRLFDKVEQAVVDARGLQLPSWR